MKKGILIIVTIFCFSDFLFGQKFAIGLDKNNFFYISIDNPITVAVEGVDMKYVELKASNGSIINTNEGYIFRSNQIGSTEITVYKVLKGKSIKLGSYFYRVKGIPNPIFKIGSGKDIVRRIEFISQQYARAELENFDFDIRYSIDSFKVCMFFIDSCKYIERINRGNKLNDELRNDFKLLKQDDIIIFKNIFVKGPDGQKEIAPRLIKIIE